MVYLCNVHFNIIIYLSLLQVFVETLDKCFENVCELDLIFHMDKVGKNQNYMAMFAQDYVY